MKLKYYLRGLGVGVIAATLVLMIAFSGHDKELSDEEIIKRAEALGMVMDASSEEKDEIPEMAETEEALPTELPVKVIEPTETQTAEVVPDTETSETEAEAVNENDKIATPDTEAVVGKVQPQMTEKTEEEISFTINAGQSSDTVAFNLYSAGIVDDATAFNTYMVKNGYDSRLSTGTFKIKKNASYSEIANTLVR
ncbi:MAG: hypothetical protein UHU19_14325 [Lachnospiraceae bacterium]|nr:hypothetical protein [Lachnospiraceae bacterium]